MKGLVLARFVKSGALEGQPEVASAGRCRRGVCRAVERGLLRSELSSELCGFPKVNRQRLGGSLSEEHQQGSAHQESIVCETGSG